MTLQVGIIGMGMMGGVHLSAWMDVADADVRAICDIRPERLTGDGVEGNLGAVGGDSAGLDDALKLTDVEELLAVDEIDIVDLCLPTYLHAPVAAKAFAARKHVFCEKPLALTVEDAKEMIAGADRAGRMLGVGHCLRYWPEYVQLKEWIDQSAFGPAEHAVFTRIGGFPDWSWNGWMADPARSGSGALDLHIHDVDLVQWIFGRPVSLTASGTFDDAGGLAHVTTTYRFKGRHAPQAVAIGGWQKGAEFHMSAAVKFRSATVEFDHRADPTLIIRKADGVEEVHVEHANAYREELADFARAVSTGRPVTRITPADAARAVALVEAEVRAARDGGSVELSD